MRSGTGFANGRAYAFALLAAAGASALACALGAAACITSPPPDLPTLTDPRPTILHDAVQPPEGPLFDWPSEFIVPVAVDLPNETFVYNVFVDYPAVDQGFSGAGPMSPPDGGITLVNVPLPQPDTPICPHRIDFLVANTFDFISSHTPTSIGGDIVTWWYYPDGGPGGCPAYDAGSGAFPDAPVDGLLVTPESGGDP